MTKMVAMPICDKKNFKNILLRTRELMILKLGIEHPVLNIYMVCIKDDFGLALTNLQATSNLAKLLFVLKLGPYIVELSEDH